MRKRESVKLGYIMMCAVPRCCIWAELSKGEKAVCELAFFQRRRRNVRKTSNRMKTRAPRAPPTIAGVGRVLAGVFDVPDTPLASDTGRKVGDPETVEET